MDSAVSTTYTKQLNHMLLCHKDNNTIDLFSDPDVLERLIQYSFVGCTVLSAEALESLSDLTSLMGSSLRLANSVSVEHLKSALAVFLCTKYCFYLHKNFYVVSNQSKSTLTVFLYL